MKYLDKGKYALGLLALFACGSAQAIPIPLGNVVDHGDGSYTISSDTSVTDGDIEAFLGLAPGTLDGISTNGATVGSAIKDTTSVGIGDVFAFDWEWFSGEGSNTTTFNDFSFASLSLDGVTVLADTFTADNTISSFNWVATSSGLLTYGIGAMNVGDKIYQSHITVSNVTSTAKVPEPGSVALLGIGLSALLVGFRRRQAKFPPEA